MIEQSGKQGESYTVADDLQVVYACQANGKYTMWARDLVDNIDAVEIPEFDNTHVDYMSHAGQQAGTWQQNNWVMLDFAGVSADKYSSIAYLLAQGKHPVVKGGTLSGQFVDQRNYTIKVNKESSLQLDTDVDNYVFNVYCPANYGPNEGGWQEREHRSYWFMTPKVMEVATHTWSVWKASGDDGAFYMPERKFEDGKWTNEANLLGAYDVAWDYNYNAGSFRPTDGKNYQFLAVTMLKSEQQSEPAGAPRRVGAQPGSQPNATQVVNPLDLNSDEHVVTAVNRLVADRQVVSVTYCDVAGRMSTKPFKGVNIVVTRYSDGTQQTTKTTIF